MYSLLTKPYRPSFRGDKRRPEDGIGVFSAPKVPQGSCPLRHRLVPGVHCLPGGGGGGLQLGAQ